jgi:glutaredoxin
MVRNIELYTRDRCSNCTKTKNTLLLHGLNWTEYQIDVDLTREDVLAKFPEAKMLPVVVVDGTYIGSMEDLNEMISKTGIDQ